MNEDLLRVIRANVREPLQVEGDVYALAACNDEGSRRLVEMMEEFGIANLDRLGEHIIETSRQATIEAIGKLTPGNYRNSLTMDGYDRPLTLAAEMTIGDDGIHVDLYRHLAGERLRHQCRAQLHDWPTPPSGSNAWSRPRCRTMPARSRRSPSARPRAASLNVKRPRAVAAPAYGRAHAAGCRVRLPASGDGRRRAGRGRLVAVDPADLWRRRRARRARCGGRRAPPDIKPFSTAIFHCGGAGARPGKDGLDVTAFPSGVRTIPVEATEAVAPVLFRRREFREGSGGAGRYRGGLGQIIELGGTDGTPIAMLCNFERVGNPARGRDGGGTGAPGRVTLVSGRADRPQGPAERARRRFHPPRIAGRRRLRRSRRTRSRAGRTRRRRRADLARERRARLSGCPCCRWPRRRCRHRKVTIDLRRAARYPRSAPEGPAAQVCLKNRSALPPRSFFCVSGPRLFQARMLSTESGTGTPSAGSPRRTSARRHRGSG